MSDRHRIDDFVRQCLARRVLSAKPLAAGLGHRRFYRLELDGAPRHVIARLDPAEDRPASSREPPLEPLRSVLEAAGLPVPESFGSDPSGELDLLEDVGSRSLESVAGELPVGALEELYARVLEDLAKLQAIREPLDLPAFERRLDPELLAGKARLFAEYSLADPGCEVARDAFAAVAELLADAPWRLAHRDFQSQNILIQSDARGALRPRWIDFQGAFLAPPEYDPVCLLHDSYVAIPEDCRARLLEGVRSVLPDPPDAETFGRRFDLLTLVRKGKDHARFREAAAQRGDRRYLKYSARTWRSVRVAASACAELDPRLTALWERIQTIDPNSGGGE